MLGIFFSYKNTFFYSGNQYIINSVDWDDTFKQLRDSSKLLKRMNASYYINLKLFLEKLEPGKLPSDRKGTFLESCGVKGAIIRNEWKNNFESKTLEEWKKVFGFGKKKEGEGKGEGAGEGIFDKLVPSFIKNAIKSIKNPLMSPLDPGVLQVSLIQYSLLSESELQAYYPKIENSFSGVAWKNDNTWEKRRERLFSAMDECQADIYCFQNVQCSIAVYDKCIADANLDDAQKKTLRDINKSTIYRERLNLYLNSIHDKLISTDDADTDALNCVSDIYKKYKDSYDFVYFFEQVFYTSDEMNNNPLLKSLGYIPNMLYPEYGKKVALGNLTMVKKSKFEIVKKFSYDVRIGAAFCLEKVKKDFSKEFPTLFQVAIPLPGQMPGGSPTPANPKTYFAPQYNSICMNKSFASMVYIKFRTSETSETSETSVAEEIPVEQMSDKTEEKINEALVDDEALLNKEYGDIINENTEEEEGKGEGKGEGAETLPDKSSASNSTITITPTQGGGAPTWYDKDTTEVEGYDKKLKEDTKSKSKDKTGTPPDEPQICFDTKDVKFIPTSELGNSNLFGICNIKFDTKDIIIPGTPGPSVGLPIDDMQVVLMAIFIYKLRFNMQSYGLSRLTSVVNNPFIVCGIFRGMVTGTSDKPVLNHAVKLLTTSTRNTWKDANSPFKTQIEKFVKDMSILTYLSVGTFRLAGFIFKQNKFNSKLLGDVYPLEQRSGSGSSMSELIICPRNFKICNDSKIMHKMIPVRNSDQNFPIFPNKVNPSNSVAIGGVFDITTPAIKSHVEQVKAKIKEKLEAEDKAVTAAQLAAVERERGIEQGRFSEKLLEALQDKIRPDDKGNGDGSDGGNDDDDDDDDSPPPPGASAAAPPKALGAAPVAPLKAPVIVDDAAAAAPPKPPVIVDDAAAAAPPKAPVTPPPGPPPSPPGPPPPSPPSGVTKYIFAFDMDDTLFEGGTILNTLSTNPSDVQYRSEIIANMKRVIDSRNYVWIVTANDEYTKDIFTRNFFGPDKDFFDKSEYYFLFMNPLIMADTYTKAKNDPSLPAGDKAKLDYTGGWTESDIHGRGLKPYAMYAQSLLTRSEYNSNPKLNPKIDKFDIYLFDDMSGSIQTNSQKFGIHFIQVTDFASSPATPNLLTEFKKVLDNGTSKIASAKAPFIPTEYTDENVKQALMANNPDLPKCESDFYINKPDDGFNYQKNSMIGDKNGGVISNNLQVCVNGNDGYDASRFITDTDITKWTTSSGDFYSDHEPIKYNYVIDDTTNVVTCASGNTQNKDVNTSFITWNIAYKMIRTGKFYLSKFYCSQAANPKACIEDDKIYEKRMQNILTAIDTIMENSYNKYTNYVFLQECTPKLIDAVKNVTGFGDIYQIFSNQSEFCLVVRKSAPHASGDIVIFDFGRNKDGSPAMSNYISREFYSYDIEVNTPDLKRVMCYIVKSKATIFFNVHFSFNDKAPYIFQRQAELYNFMNAIVYSIRSIPQSNTELYPYQNYDIVFTGDFNVNMLQRFPQDVKRFGYPDSNNMIPIFFTCNYIKEQKTIISTTYINIPSARATNGDTANYNLTNIDFSIFYPRIGDAGPTPTPVTILNDGIPKKLTLPVAPVGSVGSSAPGSSSSSSSSSPSTSSTPATTLKVMSFNTWYKPFNAQKKNDDGILQEPDMQYCNVNKDGKITNVCQENIMNEIMTQIKEGFQVIFLQEFTTRIRDVFDKCTFSDEYVDKKQIPFTMTYTPPSGGKVPPLEYYVYSVTAQGETIVTLCSKSFFKNPATQYYMGNLTGYPNNPSYASDGHITQFWEISGGGRPYIVLVFDDEQMILINIHGPHGGTFNPYLQKVSKNPSGKGDFTTIGEKDSNGSYKYEKTMYKYNSVFGTSISTAVQTEINKKIQAVTDLNNEYPTLQDYTFRQLGDMLRKRIPQKLKEYNIIFAGDFNMRPDDAKTHLVKLSERLSTGNYGEGPFSNSSGVFDKGLQNSLKLKVGDTDNDATGTCCVANSSSSYGSGIYDQIYSNKLQITKYWTYNGKIEYDKKGGILFSDHLPVYAEIELPASAPSPPSSGGSKRFTLRNNINNNNNNKPTSRKIRKSASASASMPTTKFTKKQHSHNKKHKTRRHKH